MRRPYGPNPVAVAVLGYVGGGGVPHQRPVCYPEHRSFKRIRPEGERQGSRSCP